MGVGLMDIIIFSILGAVIIFTIIALFSWGFLSLLEVAATKIYRAYLSLRGCISPLEPKKGNDDDIIYIQVPSGERIVKTYFAGDTWRGNFG